MNIRNTFIFETIQPSHPELPLVIALSVGHPTSEKIQKVVDSYKSNNQQLIGCFLDQKLIAVIGIELIFPMVTIRHISVL
jgi:hypothetical protein